MLFAESYSLQSVPCITVARTFSQLCSIHITNLLHPYNFVTNLANVLPMHSIFYVPVILMWMHETKCPLNIMEHHGCAATVRIPPGASMSVSSACCMWSGKRSLWRVNHSSRGVLLSVVCLVWSRHLSSEEAYAH